MKRSIGVVVLLAAVLAAFNLVATAGADSASDGDRVLRSELIGSTPPPAGPTLFGVVPAGAPWIVAASDVDARRDGRIEARVEGLVIPGRGTGTVATVTASLFCGGESVGETAPVPLSADGDAEIDDTIAAAPDQCLAPVVFVHPNNDETRYIAVTGA
jgi:hypothetical protein